LRGGRRHHRDRPGDLHRLRCPAAAHPRRPGARFRRDGAVRRAGNHSGDRLLSRLRAAPRRPLRHRLDVDRRLRHALLPIAYSGSESALRTIDVDLENAARTLGATALGAFRRITLPLLRRHLVTTWLTAFIPSLRELSSAVFLFTPATAVMTN